MRMASTSVGRGSWSFVNDSQIPAPANYPDDIGTRIDPVLAPQLAPGPRFAGERFQLAAHSRADIIVLDIEDAVAPKDKVAARDNVIEWLAAGNRDWVRVNGFGTEWGPRNWPHSARSRSVA